MFYLRRWHIKDGQGKRGMKENGGGGELKYDTFDIL
jgi:hypothetical protein